MISTRGLGRGSNTGGMSVFGFGITFPVQFFGLYAFYGGSTVPLSLVGIGQSPQDLGGVLRIKTPAGVREVYLVDINDPFASSIRTTVAGGTKAVRVKT